MNRITLIAFASALIGFFGVVQVQAANDDCIESGLKTTQESTPEAAHGEESYTAESGCRSDKELTSGERDLMWTIKLTHW